MTAGDVFRFEGIADIHVWMIISDPAIDADKVLMVSFTSYDRLRDQACILDKGDHPFINHRTCVEYSRAKVVRAKDLDTLLGANRLIKLDPLSTALLARIRQGAMNSTEIPMEMAQLLVDQELIDEL